MTIRFAPLLLASLIVAFLNFIIFFSKFMPSSINQIVFFLLKVVDPIPHGYAVLVYGLGLLWLGMFIFAVIRFGYRGLWLLIGAPGGLVVEFVLVGILLSHH